MVTIVSCFIGNMNNNRSVETYLDHGKHLLIAKINKIIFIDECLYDRVKSYENESTHIIPVNRSDIYLYDYVNLLTEFNLNTDNPSKDSIDYMLMICSKTEWMRKAIELNYFDLDDYVWVDFGIRHVFANDCDFVAKIESLKTKSYDKVRIGSIWDLNLIYSAQIYKDINWYFAGGVFGGNKVKLLEFARLTKDMCIDTMNAHKTIMWEVNIWYLVFQNNRDLFDDYKCNHDSSIIDNY
jgi:hypothetical protein